MRSYRSVRHGTLKRAVGACSKLSAYHFWLASPWLAILWILFCFTLAPR
jgi:hypothetical protein